MNVYYTIEVARAGLPRLTVAQRVVDKIVRDALIYETETGEALAGLALNSPNRLEPDLYVLDTIAPDTSAVRRGAYFEQGDEQQAEIMKWWSDNWKAFPDHYRRTEAGASAGKWNVPLRNLGNWHKHPGDLVSPSGGDTATALDDMFDQSEGVAYLLVFLATVWDPRYVKPDSASEMASPILVSINPETTIRIDCWYMSRRTRRFARLVPDVVPDSSLPRVPELPWDISQPDRTLRESDALTGAGYSVVFDQFNADGQAPLELCLTVDKPGSRYIYIIVTDWDYPARMPAIRTVPVGEAMKIAEDANYFRGLWEISQPLSKTRYPLWVWSPDHTLLDLIQAVDEKPAPNPSESASKEKTP